MQLSNILLPLALIASTAFAAPTATGALEKRATQIFYFPGDGTVGAGQPPNFSATTYPYFCYFPDKDFKLYFHVLPPRCGGGSSSVPIQQTDPNATIA